MMQRRFTTVAWSYNSNIYEVNVRQYTPEGTFNAFAAHLPRLRDMGVEILWFMPITPISRLERLGTLGSYYACSDYKAINPEFGTLQDFANLVQQAHALGFKVIIDWVANHTGHDHVWTKTNPGFFKRNADGHFYDTHGWQDVIDLNYYDAAMRQAMIDAMAFWVKECDIDGFRCDMAHLVPLDFWRDARTRLETIKPLFWLAETDHLIYAGVFDSYYGWHWMKQTEKYAKGHASIFNLKDVLACYDTLTPEYTFPLFFTTNHDENSWNGTEYEKYDGAAQTLAVFNSTWYGLPLIYSGQELPNRKRLKFFEKDPIEWTGHYELHDFYKTLLQVRKHAALQPGNVKPLLISTNQNQHVLAFTRGDAGEILVILNLSPHPLPVMLPEGTVRGTYTNIFTGKKVKFTSELSLPMDGWGYLVLVKQEV